MMKKQRAENLVCYKEGRTQKWIMTTPDNDDEVCLNLLKNEKVDNSSIFIIPTCGMMFGAIWLDNTIHETRRFSFQDFFTLFGKRQPKIKTNEDVKITAEKIKEEREIRKKSKYGFISPEGVYFYCEFEGHHSLAYDICFGQYETNNPEAYLTEDLGWCKIIILLTECIDMLYIPARNTN